MKTYQVIWRLLKKNSLFRSVDPVTLFEMGEEIRQVEFLNNMIPIRERFKAIVEYKPTKTDYMKDVLEKTYSEFHELQEPLGFDSPLRFPPTPIIPREDARFDDLSKLPISDKTSNEVLETGLDECCGSILDDVGVLESPTPKRKVVAKTAKKKVITKRKRKK